MSLSVFFVDAATFEIINKLIDTKTFQVTRKRKKEEDKRAAYLAFLEGASKFRLKQLNK